MDIKTVSEESPDDRLRSFFGVILASTSAFTAEVVFAQGFTASPGVVSIARMALVFLTVYLVHRFAVLSLRSYNPGRKDLATLSLILCASFVIVWLCEILAMGPLTYAQSVNSLSGISIDTLHFAIPFATGAFLVQAVLGLHYGLVFSVCFSLILGIYSPNNPMIVPYVLATCLMACLSLRRFRTRSAYIKAGLNVTLIALPFALSSVVFDGDVTVTDISLRLIGTVINGTLCAFLAAGFTPIMEYLGGYVTDMRLIEMATIDHVLLKELSIQAPGTWNHSMVIGMMVEAAADAIGANPVLARVGAYFHDIGKMKKPLYFVENQGGGENRHDKLSTSMSALIIRSHVKDGIELAQKHGLPQPIIDMIPQHHGTSVIEFFYDKACKEVQEAGEDSSEVDKSLYTYPGPKPQTKEAGILMLADGIEAAARTLKDPSHDRIQGMVQKMINRVFSSGQLNECELTLADLHLIAKNFTRILSSIYHQRVAYAEPAEKGGDKPTKKDSSGSSKETQSKETKKKSKSTGSQPKKEDVTEENQQEKESAPDTAEEESSKSEEQTEEEKPEDLKRLGM